MEKKILNDNISNIIKSILQKFTQELCGSEEEIGVRGFSRYSFVHLVDNSRDMNVNDDKELISKFVESTLKTDVSVKDDKGIRIRSLDDGYRKGIFVYGDKYSLIWMPSVCC